MKIRNVVIACAAVLLMACPGPTPTPPVDSTTDTTVTVPTDTLPTPVISRVVVAVSVDGFVVSGTTAPSTAILILSPASTELFPAATTTSDSLGVFKVRLKTAGEYKVCKDSNKLENCNTDLITVPLN